MKLRIHGDAVRLRLSRTDVARVADGGEVAVRTRMGLTYRLLPHPAPEIRLEFHGGTMTVMVPDELARFWATGDEVGLYADAGHTHVSIEKDFQCMKARDDQSDNFPNPDVTPVI